MKHRYSVLWFEDNDEVMQDDYAPALTDFLLERGFTLDLEHRKNFSKGDVINYSKYDLIVTDLNLGGDNPDDAGGRVLQAVRHDDVLTDIVFYSSDAGRLTKVLSELKFINRVTLHSGRRGLMDVVLKVVQLTVKKSEGIYVVRGQFIAEAIDLENKLLDFLGSYLGQKFIPEIAEAKSKSWGLFVKRKLKSLTKQAEIIQTHDHAKAGLHELKFFQSFDAYDLTKDGLEDMANHCKKLAEKGDKEGAARAALLLEIRKKLVEFNDEVIDVRNTLAHVKEAVVGNKTVLKSRKASGAEITIDEAWCTATRRSLRAHHDNLERMAELLKVPPA